VRDPAENISSPPLGKRPSNARLYKNYPTLKPLSLAEALLPGPQSHQHRNKAADSSTDLSPDVGETGDNPGQATLNEDIEMSVGEDRCLMPMARQIMDFKNQEKDTTAEIIGLKHSLTNQHWLKTRIGRDLRTRVMMGLIWRKLT